MCGFDSWLCDEVGNGVECVVIIVECVFEIGFPSGDE